MFVSHAYPTPLSPPLDFSLSILEGEAAVRARRRKGPIRGGFCWRASKVTPPLSIRSGSTRQSRDRDFHPKAIAWPKLAAIVDDCRRHFHARQMVIRWHPSMLQPARLADALDDLSGIVESPRSASLADVARECDWVVADENSNLHLPVLKLGIPTVAVKNLGLYPASHADLYGFVANGIIFPSVASVRDVRARRADARSFPDRWAARFEQYDASYLRSREDCRARHPSGSVGAFRGRRTRRWRERGDAGRRARSHARQSGVSGALLVGALRQSRRAHGGRDAAQGESLWLVASVGLILPITVLRAIRFFWVAPPGALPGVGEALRLTLAASALNMVVPGQGRRSHQELLRRAAQRHVARRRRRHRRLRTAVRPLRR